MSIEFRPQIQDLVAYKPGKPIDDVKKEYGLDRVIKLASNENPLGCSENANNAIQDALSHLHIYPDGNSTNLKAAIADKFNIKPSQILPSSGSDEMVDQISKTFIQEGDEVIMADITFPRYISTCKMMGGIPVIVPLLNHTYDLAGMKEKITDKTRMIWLCNPNNPTGTMFTTDILEDFLASVPKDIVIIYDEAYREFVTRKDYPQNSLRYLEKYPNLIVMRTFSKAYGLAALRVGFTIASEEIIDHINRIRGPFNVNTLAQVAAIAALDDDAFIEKIYSVNKEGKEFFYHNFDELGLEYAPSETNHVLVDVKRDAQEIFVELQKRGVIVRPIYGTFIRVSVGTMEENTIFVNNLKDVL